MSDFVAAIGYGISVLLMISGVVLGVRSRRNHATASPLGASLEVFAISLVSITSSVLLWLSSNVGTSLTVGLVSYMLVLAGIAAAGIGIYALKRHG